MSLQVWLPLNGNINNQGICDSLEVSAGTPQYIDGKMGQGIDISHRVTFTGLPRLNNFSIFFWLKVDSCTVSWADSLGFDCKQADGTNAASFRFEATTETRACSWHNNSPYGISSGSQILIQNYEEWHHVGLTYDGDNVYSYIDGKLKYTNSGLGGYLIDRFWIGETANIVGAMNDLRIYDNILSKSEIKEISKGLVLHYNFEDGYGQDNLLRGTATWRNLTDQSNTSINNDILTISSNTSYPKYEIIDVSSNEVYTVSVDVKANEVFSPTNGLMIFDYLNSNGGRISYSWGGGIPLTVWKRLSWKITIPNNSEIKKMYVAPRATDGKTLYFRKMKIEKGDKETVWEPNPEDIEYIDREVFDSSGLGNNGSAISNRCPNWDTDNAEGQYSVNFDGNQYIQTKDFLPNLIDELTLSLWAYRDDWKYSSQVAGSSIIGNIDGGGFGLKWEYSFLCCPIYYKSIGYNSNNNAKCGFTTDNLKSGWHHFVLIASKNYTKCYLDGILHNLVEHNFEKEIQLNSLFHLVIGAEQNSNNYIGWKGKVDDVRMYSTALSDEDVKQLYDVKAHIDKNNNILCNNFVEEHSMFLMDESSAHKTSGDVNDITYCDGRTIKIKINQARDWQCVWFPLEDFIDNGKTYHLYYRVNPECPKNVNYDNIYGLIGIHKYKISDNSVVKAEARLTDTNLHLNFAFSVDYSTYKDYRLIFFPTCTDSTSGIGKTYIYDDIDIVEVDTTKKTNISKKYQLTTGNITEEKDKVRFKKHNKTECNEIIEI
nr:MAG TPA: Concanavalin A-like lectin/glucanase superfamily protein [Bacteriophage sp.]